MSHAQDGQGPKAGRTKKEIAHAAHCIDVEDQVRKFHELPESAEAFSYSLEDGRFYDMAIPEDREALVNLYGEGKKDTKVYIIGITNHLGKMDAAYATRKAKKCAELGRVPFIGHWNNLQGHMYEDISYAINHGVPIEWIQEELRRCSQVEVLEVTKAGCTVMPGQTGHGAQSGSQ